MSYVRLMMMIVNLVKFKYNGSIQIPTLRYNYGYKGEGDVGIQGKTKLNQLISELSAVDEGECESCAV